jgi:hypothetical protein
LCGFFPVRFFPLGFSSVEADVYQLLLTDDDKIPLIFVRVSLLSDANDCSMTQRNRSEILAGKEVLREFLVLSSSLDHWSRDFYIKKQDFVFVTKNKCL